jgi:3-methyl-2-oxobutanoate hydroxymethyltransferase
MTAGGCAGGRLERKEDDVPTKKSVLDLHEMKQRGEMITWLTGYDYPTALFEEAAGVDMILVGDSLGMCVYGYPSTVPVTMDQCIVHCEAVRRGAPNTFVMGDLPFMSYQVSDEDAVVNAGRLLKEANVDAVKLEGGVRVLSRVKAILDAGIVVCGHIGLTPQSSGQLGGHKAQGRTLESAKLVVEDARALARAGVHLLLLEAVPPEVAGFIRAELPIPVLGIGAGADVDGQVLIISDVLGTFPAFTPKFVKKYADLASVSVAALKEYVADVRAGRFPQEEHCYRMLEGESEKFAAFLRETAGREAAP